MTRLVVDVEAEGRLCKDCRLHRIDWLNCPLFGAVLEFDEERHYRLRCPECLEAGQRAKDAGIA